MDIIAVIVGFFLAVVAFYIFRVEDPAASESVTLDDIYAKQEQILANLDQILESVSEFSTIGDSLDELFTQLQTLIQQGQQDPAKLQQALDMVSTSKERTKAAIVANTPVSGEVPPSSGNFGR